MADSFVPEEDRQLTGRPRRSPRGPSSSLVVTNQFGRQQGRRRHQRSRGSAAGTGGLATPASPVRRRPLSPAPDSHSPHFHLYPQCHAPLSHSSRFCPPPLTIAPILQSPPFRPLPCYFLSSPPPVLLCLLPIAALLSLPRPSPSLSWLQTMAGPSAIQLRCVVARSSDFSWRHSSLTP